MNFTSSCHTTYKNQISLAIHHNTIKSILQSIDLDVILGKQAAFEAFRASYGCRNWLLAPEDGVRGLLQASMLLFEPPLQHILESVHSATVQAAISALQDCTILKPDDPLIACQAEQTVHALLLDQATSTLKQWKEQTWEQLQRNLRAESSFPAPSRFASLKLALTALLTEEASQRARKRDMEHKIMFGEAPAEINACEAPKAILKKKNTSEFFMGWMEKRNRRGCWQKRWFVLSSKQKRLWYFKRPEEQPARAVVCLNGQTMLYQDEENPRVFQLLLPHILDDQSSSTWHAPTGRRTKTNIYAMGLRAPSEMSKAQWIEMIQNAIDNNDTKEIIGDKNDATCSPVADDGVPTEPASSSLAKPAAVPDSNDDHQIDAVIAVEKGIEQEGNIEEGKCLLLKREMELFDEVMLQAKRAPTQHESRILDCIIQFIKAYIEEVFQPNLIEQSAKVIADGMLPIGREYQLRNELLKVLIPQIRSNGSAVLVN